MDTGKFWWLLIAIVVVVGLCVLTSGRVRAQVSGDVVTVPAFCSTEDAARELAAAVAADNDAGYLRVMRSDAACFDVRLHPRVQPATVVLLERAFSVTRADGLTFDFWLASDDKGHNGYVWKQVSPPVAAALR